MSLKLHGAITALVTPFRNGRVDEAALKRLVDFQIEHGATGLVPCGSTGESATLSHDEHDRVIELVIEAAGARIPVIAGTGSNNTQEAIRLTRHAKDAGASAALIISPYYNKPTQRGLYLHFKAIADAVDIPIVLYNIASRTAVNIEPETIAQLVADCPTIIAVKESSGNLEQMSRILQLTKRRVTLLSGDDSLTLPVLSIGGTGVISVVSNLVPRDVAAMVSAYERGDRKAAIEWHDRLLPLIRAMFIETNPAPVKTAMGLLGMIDPELRLPLCAMSDANQQRLRDELDAYGLFAKGKARAQRPPARSGRRVARNGGSAMAEAVSIAIPGCGGRMGQRIAALALQDSGMKLAAGLEAKGHALIGRDLGDVLGAARLGIAVTDDAEAALRSADILIDFTRPEPTMEHVQVARRLRRGIVIGTTGFSDAQQTAIRDAAKEIPVLLSPNMSVGVNLLFELVQTAARRLGLRYDVEIVEAHHRAKQDAPSGTAKRLAQAAADGRGQQPQDVPVHAIRAGDIVGDHTVLFAGPFERLELTHRAHGRDAFAIGALSAARFLRGQRAGLYDMSHVLQGGTHATA